MATNDPKLVLRLEIAEAMECPPDLLPYLPELLADLEELGGSRRLILQLLRPLQLPPGARVLDLGCGKGAVLLALAEELGLCGVGVDAFSPFVEAARQAAARRGLADRCQFRCADLREVVADHRDFDVAMLLALGAAIGSPDELVGLLRQCVRPGGYMVIDDSFLAPGVQGPVPGYESYSDHATALRGLTAHGDELLQEFIVPPEEAVQVIAAQIRSIRPRAEALIRQHPGAADMIRGYLQRQERELALARDTVLNVVWLLGRAG